MCCEVEEDIPHINLSEGPLTALLTAGNHPALSQSTRDDYNHLPMIVCPRM